MTMVLEFSSSEHLKIPMHGSKVQMEGDIEIQQWTGRQWGPQGEPIIFSPGWERGGTQWGPQEGLGNFCTKACGCVTPDID